MGRKARSYICAYAEIECEKVLSGEIKGLNHDMIEKNAKKYKTHRSCLDIHSSYINHLENI